MLEESMQTTQESAFCFYAFSYEVSVMLTMCRCICTYVHMHYTLEFLILQQWLCAFKHQ